MLVFLPDWLEEEYLAQEEYLTALRCTWFREDKLTHRDILGGPDGPGGAPGHGGGTSWWGRRAVICWPCPPWPPFLRDNFVSAGRVKLRVTEIPLDQLRLPVQHRKELHDTVAALRLDSVLAVGFSISRSKAAQLISAGRCAVNWQDTTKGDLTLRAGDVISCRGAGQVQADPGGGD